MTDKIIYEWGLYDNVADDHFNCNASPQEIAEAMPDPDITIRLIRYERNGEWDDCVVLPNGLLEYDAYFGVGYGTKVPKRYIEQLARWVKKYGHECNEVWTIDK
jgi:hypothetical protein